MSKIKDDNFYTIKGWMLNRLKLKGAQLQIYSIIYGFSQDGESEFTGSLNYLKDWLGVSKPTVIKALQALEDAGLIIKTPLVINNVTFNKYKVNRKVIDSIFNGGKETLLPIQEPLQVGSQETLPTGSQETLPNKDISYKELDIDKNKDIYTSAEPTETEDKFFGIVKPVKEQTTKPSKKQIEEEYTREFEEIWKEYPRKEGKIPACKSYIKARKDGVSKEIVLEGVRRYVDYCKKVKKERQYTKQGKTWFNERGWDDEYIVDSKLQGGSNGRPTESPTISYIEQQARQNPNSGLAKLFEEL